MLPATDPTVERDALETFLAADPLTSTAEVETLLGIDHGRVEKPLSYRPYRLIPANRPSSRPRALGRSNAGPVPAE
jgi:hypothetical protein